MKRRLYLAIYPVNWVCFAANDYHVGKHGGLRYHDATISKPIVFCFSDQAYDELMQWVRRDTISDGTWTYNRRYPTENLSSLAALIGLEMGGAAEFFEYDTYSYQSNPWSGIRCNPKYFVPTPPSPWDPFPDEKLDILRIYDIRNTDVVYADYVITHVVKYWDTRANYTWWIPITNGGTFSESFEYDASPELATLSVNAMVNTYYRSDYLNFWEYVYSRYTSKKRYDPPIILPDGRMVSNLSDAVVWANGYPSDWYRLTDASAILLQANGGNRVFLYPCWLQSGDYSPADPYVQGSVVVDANPSTPLTPSEDPSVDEITTLDVQPAERDYYIYPGVVGPEGTILLAYYDYASLYDCYEKRVLGKDTPSVCSLSDNELDPDYMVISIDDLRKVGGPRGWPRVPDSATHVFITKLRDDGVWAQGGNRKDPVVHQYHYWGRWAIYQ